MNLVILQACTNNTYLRNQLRKLTLILRSLFLVEAIFKIGSLNMLGTEPLFYYRELPKCRDLRIKIPEDCS